MLGTAPSATAARFDEIVGFSLDPTDSPTQTGKFQHGAPSGCSPAKAAPAVDPGAFNYDGILEQSTINEPACLTVEIATSDPTCWSNGLFSASYLGDFDDTNIQANYLGDVGNPPSDPTSASYSMVVPAGQTLATVFHMSVSGTGCSSFDVVWSSDRPWNSVAPQIIGHPFVGQTLGSFSGAWSAGTLARQWRRCALDGSGCADIPGANGQSYVVAPDDVGHALRLRVAATDGGMTSTSDSAPTIAGVQVDVLALQSLNSSDPTQSGRLGFNPAPATCASPRAGIPPAVDTSHSRFYDAFARINQSEGPLCAIASLDTPGGCTGARGAMSAAYLPGFDPGTSIRTNYLADGGADAIPGTRTVNYSFTVPAGAHYDVVVMSLDGGVTCSSYDVRLGATAPYPTESPTVYGMAMDGNSLIAENGRWTGSPAFTYQWRRCLIDGSGCTDVTGAAGSTYPLSPADVGHSYRVRVTAREGAGSASKSSAATAPVAPKPFAGIALKRATVSVRLNGVVNLTLACPATARLACVGTDTLKLGKQKLGSRSFLIFGGAKGKLRIALAKKFRTRLAKRKKLKAAQIVLSRDASRVRVTTRAPLILKAKKP